MSNSDQGQVHHANELIYFECDIGIGIDILSAKLNVSIVKGNYVLTT